MGSIKCLVLLAASIVVAFTAMMIAGSSSESPHLHQPIPLLTWTSFVTVAHALTPEEAEDLRPYSMPIMLCNTINDCSQIKTCSSDGATLTMSVDAVEEPTAGTVPFVRKASIDTVALGHCLVPTSTDDYTIIVKGTQDTTEEAIAGLTPIAISVTNILLRSRYATIVVSGAFPPGSSIAITDVSRLDDLQLPTASDTFSSSAIIVLHSLQFVGASELLIERVIIDEIAVNTSCGDQSTFPVIEFLGDATSIEDGSSVTIQGNAVTFATPAAGATTDNCELHYEVVRLTDVVVDGQQTRFAITNNTMTVTYLYNFMPSFLVYADVAKIAYGATMSITTNTVTFTRLEDDDPPSTSIAVEAGKGGVIEGEDINLGGDDDNPSDLSITENTLISEFPAAPADNCQMVGLMYIARLGVSSMADAATLTIDANDADGIGCMTARIVTAVEGLVSNSMLSIKRNHGNQLRFSVPLQEVDDGSVVVADNVAHWGLPAYDSDPYQQTSYLFASSITVMAWGGYVYKGGLSVTGNKALLCTNDDAGCDTPDATAAIPAFTIVVECETVDGSGISLSGNIIEFPLVDSQYNRPNMYRDALFRIEHPQLYGSTITANNNTLKPANDASTMTAPVQPLPSLDLEEAPVMSFVFGLIVHCIPYVPPPQTTCKGFAPAQISYIDRNFTMYTTDLTGSIVYDRSTVDVKGNVLRSVQKGVEVGFDGRYTMSRSEINIVGNDVAASGLAFGTGSLAGVTLLVQGLALINESKVHIKINKYVVSQSFYESVENYYSMNRFTTVGTISGALVQFSDALWVKEGSVVDISGNNIAIQRPDRVQSIPVVVGVFSNEAMFTRIIGKDGYNVLPALAIDTNATIGIDTNTISISFASDRVYFVALVGVCLQEGPLIQRGGALGVSDNTLHLDAHAERPPGVINVQPPGNGELHFMGVVLPLSFYVIEGGAVEVRGNVINGTHASRGGNFSSFTAVGRASFDSHFDCVDIRRGRSVTPVTRDFLTADVLPIQELVASSAPMVAPDVPYGMGEFLGIYVGGVRAEGQVYVRKGSSFAISGNNVTYFTVGSAVECREQLLTLGHRVAIIIDDDSEFEINANNYTSAKPTVALYRGVAIPDGVGLSVTRKSRFAIDGNTHNIRHIWAFEEPPQMFDYSPMPTEPPLVPLPPTPQSGTFQGKRRGFSILGMRSGWGLGRVAESDSKVPDSVALDDEDFMVGHQPRKRAVKAPVSGLAVPSTQSIQSGLPWGQSRMWGFPFPIPSNEAHSYSAAHISPPRPTPADQWNVGVSIDRSQRHYAAPFAPMEVVVPTTPPDCQDDDGNSIPCVPECSARCLDGVYTRTQVTPTPGGAVTSTYYQYCRRGDENCWPSEDTTDTHYYYCDGGMGECPSSSRPSICDTTCRAGAYVLGDDGNFTYCSRSEQGGCPSDVYTYYFCEELPKKRGFERLQATIIVDGGGDGGTDVDPIIPEVPEVAIDSRYSLCAADDRYAYYNNEPLSTREPMYADRYQTCGTSFQGTLLLFTLIDVRDGSSLSVAKNSFAVESNVTDVDAVAGAVIGTSFPSVTVYFNSEDDESSAAFVAIGERSKLLIDGNTVALTLTSTDTALPNPNPAIRSFVGAALVAKSAIAVISDNSELSTSGNTISLHATSTAVSQPVGVGICTLMKHITGAGCSLSVSGNTISFLLAVIEQSSLPIQPPTQPASYFTTAKRHNIIGAFMCSDPRFGGLPAVADSTSLHLDQNTITVDAVASNVTGVEGVMCSPVANRILPREDCEGTCDTGYERVGGGFRFCDPTIDRQECTVKLHWCNGKFDCCNKECNYYYDEENAVYLTCTDDCVATHRRCRGRYIPCTPPSQDAGSGSGSSSGSYSGGSSSSSSSSSSASGSSSSDATSATTTTADSMPGQPDANPDSRRFVAQATTDDDGDAATDALSSLSYADFAMLPRKGVGAMTTFAVPRTGQLSYSSNVISIFAEARALKAISVRVGSGTNTQAGLLTLAASSRLAFEGNRGTLVLNAPAPTTTSPSTVGGSGAADTAVVVVTEVLGLDVPSITQSDLESVYVSASYNNFAIASLKSYKSGALGTYNRGRLGVAKLYDCAAIPSASSLITTTIGIRWVTGSQQLTAKSSTSILLNGNNVTMVGIPQALPVVFMTPSLRVIGGSRFSMSSNTIVNTYTSSEVYGAVVVSYLSLTASGSGSAIALDQNSISLGSCDTTELVAGMYISTNTVDVDKGATLSLSTNNVEWRFSKDSPIVEFIPSPTEGSDDPADTADVQSDVKLIYLENAMNSGPFAIPNPTNLASSGATPPTYTTSQAEFAPAQISPNSGGGASTAVELFIRDGSSFRVDNNIITASPASNADPTLLASMVYDTVAPIDIRAADRLLVFNRAAFSGSQLAAFSVSGNTATMNVPKVAVGEVLMLPTDIYTEGSLKISDNIITFAIADSAATSYIGGLILNGIRAVTKSGGSGNSAGAGFEMSGNAITIPRTVSSVYPTHAIRVNVFIEGLPFVLKATDNRASIVKAGTSTLPSSTFAAVEAIRFDVAFGATVPNGGAVGGDTLVTMDFARTSVTGVAAHDGPSRGLVLNCVELAGYTAEEKLGISTVGKKVALSLAGSDVTLTSPYSSSSTSLGSWSTGIHVNRAAWELLSLGVNMASVGATVNNGAGVIIDDLAIPPDNINVVLSTIVDARLSGMDIDCDGRHVLGCVGLAVFAQLLPSRAAASANGGVGGTLGFRNTVLDVSNSSYTLEMNGYDGPQVPKMLANVFVGSEVTTTSTSTTMAKMALTSNFTTLKITGGARVKQGLPVITATIACLRLAFSSIQSLTMKLEETAFWGALHMFAANGDITGALSERQTYVSVSPSTSAIAADSTARTAIAAGDVFMSYCSFASPTVTWAAGTTKPTTSLTTAQTITDRQMNGAFRFVADPPNTDAYTSLAVCNYLQGAEFGELYNDTITTFMGFRWDRTEVCPTDPPAYSSSSSSSSSSDASSSSTAASDPSSSSSSASSASDAQSSTSDASSDDGAGGESDPPDTPPPSEVVCEVGLRAIALGVTPLVKEALASVESIQKGARYDVALSDAFLRFVRAREAVVRAEAAHVVVDDNTASSNASSSSSNDGEESAAGSQSLNDGPATTTIAGLAGFMGRVWRARHISAPIGTQTSLTIACTARHRSTHSLFGNTLGFRDATPSNVTLSFATSYSSDGEGNLIVSLRPSALLYLSGLPNYEITEGEALEILASEHQLMGSPCGGRGNEVTDRSPMVVIGVVWVEPPTDAFAAAEITTVTTSVTATVASMLFGSMAAEQQGLSAAAMMTCSDPHTTGAFGSYRALSPFTLWDDYVGVIAGNTVFVVGVGIIQGIILLVLRLFNRVRRWEELSAMARFPSIVLNCSFAIHCGTAYAASQLITLDNMSETDRVVGGIAAGVVILYPFCLVGFTYFFVGRAYQTYSVTEWMLQAGMPSFVTYFVPQGAVFAADTRKTFGPLISSYRLKDVYLPSYPTWTPMIFAIGGLFHPDTIPECQALFCCMGAGFVLVCIFILIRKPRRSDAFNWLDAFARLLSAAVLFCMAVAIEPAPHGHNAALAAYSFGFIQTGCTIVRIVYNLFLSSMDHKLMALPLTHEWAHYTADGALTKKRFGSAEDFADEMRVEAAKRNSEFDNPIELTTTAEGAGKEWAAAGHPPNKPDGKGEFSSDEADVPAVPKREGAASKNADDEPIVIENDSLLLSNNSSFLSPPSGKGGAADSPTTAVVPITPQPQEGGSADAAAASDNDSLFSAAKSASAKSSSSSSDLFSDSGSGSHSGLDEDDL